MFKSESIKKRSDVQNTGWEIFLNNAEHDLAEASAQAQRISNAIRTLEKHVKPRISASAWGQVLADLNQKAAAAEEKMRGLQHTIRKLKAKIAARESFPANWQQLLDTRENACASTQH